jgi:F-type H+-transporting ATPase subunit b
LDLGLLLSQLVNFGLLVGALYLALYKPLMGRLQQRADKIRKGVEDADLADRLLADAETHYQTETDHARRDAREIVEQANRTAEQQREEILAQARQEAHEVILRAQQQAQREIQEGQVALREQVVDLGIAAAGRLLRESLDDAQHRALISQFIDDLEGLSS